MSIGTLVFIGLLAGFLVNKFVRRSGDGLVRDLAIAAGGALLGGGLLNVLVTRIPPGVTVFGVIATIAGAVAALYLHHTLFPHVQR